MILFIIMVDTTGYCVGKHSLNKLLEYSSVVLVL